MQEYWHRDAIDHGFNAFCILHPIPTGGYAIHQVLLYRITGYEAKILFGIAPLTTHPKTLTLMLAAAFTGQFANAFTRECIVLTYFNRKLLGTINGVRVTKIKRIP
jgi:hypothetical protein